MLPVAIITFLYPAFGAIVVPVLALMNYRHGCTKEMKWLFISLVFVMAALGYSMGEWGDLERYHQQLMMMETFDLSTIFQFDEDRLYVADALLYFVSQTGNMQVLNYIIGFIVYGIAFYAYLIELAALLNLFRWEESLNLLLLSLALFLFLILSLMFAV